MALHYGSQKYRVIVGFYVIKVFLSAVGNNVSGLIWPEGQRGVWGGGVGSPI